MPSSGWPRIQVPQVFLWKKEWSYQLEILGLGTGPFCTTMRQMPDLAYCHTCVNRTSDLCTLKYNFIGHPPEYTRLHLTMCSFKKNFWGSMPPDPPGTHVHIAHTYSITIQNGLTNQNWPAPGLVPEHLHSTFFQAIPNLSGLPYTCVGSMDPAEASQGRVVHSYGCIMHFFKPLTLSQGSLHLPFSSL